MNVKSIPSSYFRQIATLGAVLLSLASTPVFAEYDEKCLQLLMAKVPPSVPMAEQRQAWENIFSKIFHIDRRLTSSEYEALMDFLHGLPLLAHFSDGKKAVYQNDEDSPLRVQFFLKQATMVRVILLPQALEKLGRVYKDACKAVRRPGCEIYDDYRGFSDSRERPFTPAEEQAIKWAAIHMQPQDGLLKAFKNLPRRNIEDFQAREEKASLELAHRILQSRFPPEEADVLFEKHVKPYLHSAFARLLRLYMGVRLS